MSEGEYTSQRVGMPANEKAKQDRRLIRAIKPGMCQAQLMKNYNVTEPRLRNLAEAEGIAVVKVGNRAGRKW